MKKYIILFLLICFNQITFSQQKKKPFVKEKAPTQKEMADLMKEAQKAMGEISEEDKKMMESLGIKMPSLKK